MATGAEKPKYTHYDLNKGRERERKSCLRAQSQTFPTNIVQCLQLDHVIAKQQPTRYRQHYVENGLATAKYMYTRNVTGHTGCVNALNFSHAGEELLVSGGDDEKVLLWRVDDIVRGKCQNVPMEAPHTSNIFAATFSCDNAYIYSGGNDANLIKHDAATGKQISVHPHSEAVYSISSHPFSPHSILTASEDGAVRTIDSRVPHFIDDMALVESSDAFQCVTFNPVEPFLVATGNTRHGAALYDTRTNKKLFNYYSSKYHLFGEDVVSVSFSGDGRHLFTMQRRQPPCLYLATQPKVAATFVDENGGYMNVVSMKSGCFVGARDGYVASGSDDFRIYIWKVPKDLEVERKTIDDGVVPSPHLILPGHRSIANQIRYSPTHHLLCSSGVEKIIKLWSHISQFPDSTVQYSGGPPSRNRYTQREFLRFSMSDVESDDSMLQDIEAPDREDRGVLAFFDALVNEEERNLHGRDTLSVSSDHSGSRDSLLSELESDDSFSDIACPVRDFMRYPYPDEDPGRATWDFMTPQERWDWHHGRRDWYYEDDDQDEEDEEEDDDESVTNWSVCSCEAVDGDAEQREGEGEEGEGDKGADNKPANERVGEEHGETSLGQSSSSECHVSGGTPETDACCAMAPRQCDGCMSEGSGERGRKGVSSSSSQQSTSNKQCCSEKEQTDKGTVNDCFKPIPPAQFYLSTKRKPLPPPPSTDTRRVAKRLCSQGPQQVLPSSSCGEEEDSAVAIVVGGGGGGGGGEAGTSGTNSAATALSSGSGSQMSRKGKSRKGKRP